MATFMAATLAAIVVATSIATLCYAHDQAKDRSDDDEHNGSCVPLCLRLLCHSAVTPCVAGSVARLEVPDAACVGVDVYVRCIHAVPKAIDELVAAQFVVVPMLWRAVGAFDVPF